MAFFLIVPSVIIVTIFLVHSIAQRIGFRVKYFSLILCAVLSLAVNIAAINLSTYLDKMHFIRLGVLILIASIVVTLINRYLIRHEKTDIVLVTDAEIAEELALEQAEIESAKIIEEKKSIIKEDKPIEIEKPIEIKIPDKKSIEVKKTVDLKKNIKPKPKIEVKKSTNEIKSQEKIIKPKVEISSETKIAPTKFLKPNIKTSSDTKIVKPVTKTEIKSSKSVDEKPAQDKKPVAIENKFSEIDKHLGSLDDILDYAYSQKSKGDLNQAVLAYQRALNRYKNDDYAPFIAIDLGNIYKEQAAYTRLIKTYEDALKLPAVMRNESTKKEFLKNLAYIKIVQSVLIRHRALTMPFSKIPRQYIQEVETEFKAMQLNSSNSKK